MERFKESGKHEISACTSRDVNDLYESMAKVGSGTYG